MSEYRVGGEWFNLPENLLPEIISIINNGRPKDSYGYDSNGNYFNIKPNGTQCTFKNSNKRQSKIGDYRLTFGKYSGTKMSNMTNKDQIAYCFHLWKHHFKDGTVFWKDDIKLFKVFRWYIKDYIVKYLPKLKI